MPLAPSCDISTKLYVSKDSGLPRTHFTVAHGAGMRLNRSHNEALGMKTSYTTNQTTTSNQGHRLCCIRLSPEAVHIMYSHTILWQFAQNILPFCISPALQLKTSLQTQAIQCRFLGIEDVLYIALATGKRFISMSTSSLQSYIYHL